jgi:hypothetical protein
VDGCGGTVDCGTCRAGLVCGGGGPNGCGAASCAPSTCGSLGLECGAISDGCSKVLDCGTCSAGETCRGGQCGGGGQEGQ